MPSESPFKTKLAIASDHAGFALKKALLAHYGDATFIDLGCDSEDSVDYPDYARKVVEMLSLTEQPTATGGGDGAPSTEGSTSTEKGRRSATSGEGGILGSKEGDATGGGDGAPSTEGSTSTEKGRQSGATSSEDATGGKGGDSTGGKGAKGEVSKGVLICGSGMGMSISANRHRGIRAALCSEPSQVALARRHNNANILVLPGRFIDEATARKCLDEFLNTDFEGGRHLRRVSAIDKLPQS